MSDHTINQTHLSSKANQRIEKLGRAVEHLQIVAYHYKQASLAYRQLILQITELIETLDHIDVAAFEIHQDYTLLKAALRE
jgi:hypothetical protein